MTKSNSLASSEKDKDKVLQLYWEMANHYKSLLKIATYAEISFALTATGFALYAVVIGLIRDTSPNEEHLWLSIFASICSGAISRMLDKRRVNFKEGLEESTKNIIKHSNQGQIPPKKQSQISHKRQSQTPSNETNKEEV